MKKTAVTNFNKKTAPRATTLLVNKAYVGETIEQKVHRIINNKEPIKDGAPLIYTDRKDGVKPEMNIRTDRWELALDAMDRISADKLAKREQRHTGKDKDLGKEAREGMTKEGDGGAKSTQATDN